MTSSHTLAHVLRVSYPRFPPWVECLVSGLCHDTSYKRCEALLISLAVMTNRALHWLVGLR